jgi:uncharacterized membrane protein
MVTFTSRASKWLALALTLSLAVNLFLVGIQAAHWAQPYRLWVRMMGGEPPMAGRAGERATTGALDRMAARLSPDDRSKFQAIVERHRPALDNSNRTIRDSRRKLRDLLTADNVDRAAVEIAMSDVRDRGLELQREIQTAVLEAAESLSPEARRQLLAPPRGDRERGDRPERPR